MTESHAAAQITARDLGEGHDGGTAQFNFPAPPNPVHFRLSRRRSALLYVLWADAVDLAVALLLAGKCALDWRRTGHRWGWC